MSGKKQEYVFTKSLLESNAYDFIIEAHSLEEAIELAKRPENCPVYGGNNKADFEIRYAEGYGDNLITWRDAENKKQHLKLNLFYNK